MFCAVKEHRSLFLSFLIIEPIYTVLQEGDDCSLGLKQLYSEDIYHCHLWQAHLWVTEQHSPLLWALLKMLFMMLRAEQNAAL